METWRLTAVLASAGLVRLVLFYLGYDTVFGRRVEIVTPLNSYHRVTEGRFLVANGASPYEGDTVHETPLLLALLWTLQHYGPGATQALYVSCDLLIGWLLGCIATLGKARLQRDEEASFKNIPKQLAVSDETTLAPLTVVMFYVFNPYSVMVCVGQSTIVFTNLAIVLALYWALKGRVFMSSFAVAAATYQSLYPAVFIIPAAMLISKPPGNNQTNIAGVVVVVGAFVVWLGALLGVSFLFTNSWDFVRAVYLFILAVPDLTPNVGLYWYYFLEMFDHFRLFFLWVFQLHVLVYIGPLAVKLRRQPLFLWVMYAGIVTAFKSYPSVGDAALFLSLVSLWSHLVIYMRYPFLVSHLYLFSSFLGPIFWHLWVYAGSGNANFFFAITLVYTMATVLLAVDLMQAHQRRLYDLAHGLFVPKPGATIALE
eukprot:comp20179_c0_seq1/m.25023 comp20179_c0_seq1/g.25023  ORF comp20179_c0_seq1/g.25023 comp20179_c0_seq1/m.25023 type:complete len:427 (-) comp20179_c0_seq1:162-1442(-)